MTDDSSASSNENPQLTIHAGALVCEDLVVEGTYSVTIGPGTVVQPRCRILALGGPVVVGENNVLEERVVLENPRRPEEEEGGDSSAVPAMVIGSLNLLQVCSTFRGSVMESLNVLEPKCVVNSGCQLASSCVIGAGSHVSANSVLTDETVVFRVGGPEQVRIRKARRLREQHIVQVTRYLDILRKPNSNCYMKKSHKLLAETTLPAAGATSAHMNSSD